MDIKQLTAELSVAPQIVSVDMRAVAEAGFRSVICNRPDGVGSDQPLFSEIERSAIDQWLLIRCLPAESGKVTDEQGAAFGALMTELPKPVLAMYLSADHWRRTSVLKAIDIQFCNAGAVLFDVADCVPALMECVKAYDIGLNFGQTLISVDGPAKKASS